MLLGGIVVTMVADDATSEEAEGLAIVGGEVVAVGTKDALREYIGEDTRIIELPGSTILPGFVDSHIHPVFGLDMTRGVNLGRCRTIDEVQATLRTEADRLTEGEWLLGWGLNPNVFGEEAVSNAVLNDVAGDRPAFIRFFDAHAALASASALDSAGVTGAEEFTDGSRVVTDNDGQPTGYLLEIQAVDLVEAVLAPLSSEHRAEALYEVLLHMARAGFTSGQVQDLAPDAIDLLQTIEATRELPIRLRMSPWYVPGAPIRRGHPPRRVAGSARTPLACRGREAHDRRHRLTTERPGCTSRTASVSPQNRCGSNLSSIARRSPS